MGPFRRRSRGASLSTVPPSIDSRDYSPENAALAASILYRSPLPSGSDLPVYVLNSAAFPDANEVTYDALLPYVLARLPTDEQLIGGKGYEVVFFAGGGNSDASKRARPGWHWFLQVYQILSRAMRKRLQKLYLVHERRWIRVTFEMFSTVVSPKFRRKVVHASSLSALALHIPIEDLLIPPSAYDRDRRVSRDIYVPYASGRRAFGASSPLPLAADGNLRLPRVLRETSKFLLMLSNVRTEGLFRVNSRATTTEVLKEAYDRGQKFILWKDPPAVLAPTHFKEGFGEVTIQELEPLDGYSVHNAAGLIKKWYSSLCEPIFPQSSYAFIDRVYGGNDPPKLEMSVFLDLILQSADWSPITRNSRRILTMHLFPLLSRIAAHSEDNKMSPRNLGTCFAPSLLCGPDPIEDANMSATITRILEYGIENWEKGLSEKCHMNGTVFDDMILTPKNPADAEDSLDLGSTERRNTDRGEQTEGILMLDNDESDSESEEELTHRDPQPEDSEEHSADDAPPPPLPPRVPAWSSSSGNDTATTAANSSINNANVAPISPSQPNFTPNEISPASTGTTGTTDTQAAVRRKPAPPVQQPPRYSIVVAPRGLETQLADTHINASSATAINNNNINFSPEPMSAISQSHVADGFQSQGFGQGGRLPGYSEFDDEIPYTESPGVSRASTTASGFGFGPAARQDRRSLRKPPLETRREEDATDISPPQQPPPLDTEQVAARLAAAGVTDAVSPSNTDTNIPVGVDTGISPPNTGISPTNSNLPDSGMGGGPKKATLDHHDLMEFSPTALSPAGTGLSQSSKSSVTRKPVASRELEGDGKKGPAE